MVWVYQTMGDGHALSKQTRWLIFSDGKLSPGFGVYCIDKFINHSSVYNGLWYNIYTIYKMIINHGSYSIIIVIMVITIVILYDYKPL
jgi:purine-cytosine permease-like protein